MTQFVRPLLAQFAEPATPASPCPTLDRDIRSGLLKRAGSDCPLVEELLNSASEIEPGSHLVTIVTETVGERDPDLDRAESSRRSPRFWLSASTTDYKNVIPDPDLVRADQMSERGFWLDSLASREPKGPPVPRTPDPDFVREELMALTVTWRTFGNNDKLDPEDVRDLPR